jgi:hypothetical protein
MPIRFDCPSCKANYEVADDLAGKMIMCRVCKKRGQIKSLAAAGAATVPSIQKSVALGPSRRNFLAIGGLVVASLGSITAGALLARKPWRKWTQTDQRGKWKGPPPDKGGPPPDKGAPPPEKGGGQPKGPI